MYFNFRSKNETKMKNNLLIQKLLWFKNEISDRNEPLNDADLHALVGR